MMQNYTDKEIYELCNAFYNYEIRMEQKYKGKGYLIETKKLNKLKKSIDYANLVSIIELGETYRDFVKKIKKHEKKEVIKVENFKNSNELQNELLKDKKYNIIDTNLNSKIRNGIQTNAIDCILEKGMITIIFNENDKIYFKNNENGIIDQSSLMKNSLKNNSFIPNNNSVAQESNRNDKFLFNKEFSNKQRENTTFTSKNVNNEHNINSNNYNSPNSKQIEISNSSSQNNNKIVEQKLELNEYTKYYVEFLIRLFCSEDKLSAKIKNSNKFEIKEEKCYIINYKLIEIYEQTFKAEYLKMLLNAIIIIILLIKNIKINMNV